MNESDSAELGPGGLRLLLALAPWRLLVNWIAALFIGLSGLRKSSVTELMLGLHKALLQSLALERHTRENGSRQLEEGKLGAGRCGEEHRFLKSFWYI